MSRQGDPLVIAQEIEIRPYEQMVYAQTRIYPRESENINKYLDLARELEKKLWSMRVTVIPVVVGALGMPPPLKKKKNWMKWKSEEEYKLLRRQHY